MIYEVKANPTKGPTRKQRSLASTAVRLVRHRVTTGSDGKPLLYREQRRGAAGKPRTNLPLLVDAINGTVDVGIGFAANSYLAVTVIDLRHPRIISPDDEVKARLWAIINDIPAEVSSPPCTDRLVANSTMKQLRPSYGVPYSIYPFPPKWAASLVTGYVRVHVRLNTAAITEAFHAAGFEADCLLSACGARLQAVAQ